MPCAIHPEIVTELSTCSRCGKSFCGNCIITLRGAVVCVGCKSATIQDVKSGSVEGELELAGRGARLGAAIIDGFIIMLPIMIIIGVLAANLASELAAGGSTPFWFLFVQYGVPAILGTVYEGWMLSTFAGQTLGKKALGIRVVMPDGGPISQGQAWGRGLSRYLIQATQILGIVDVLFIFSKERSTLHDRIAKTRVVRAKA